MTPETAAMTRALDSCVSPRRRRAMARPRPSSAASIRPARNSNVPTASDPQATLVGALALAEEAMVAVDESYRRVLAAFERSLGSEHVEVADIHRCVAEADYCRGRWPEAEAHLRKAVEVRTAALGADHPATAEDEALLGQWLLAHDRTGEAEPLLRAAHRTLGSVLGPEAPATAEVSRQLASL